ncbi:MAG: chemotaxis response regulator protein-glutamate methylesterase [Pseudomonadota bacterium]
MQNCSIDALPRHHIRVLVVDDSSLMRQMLRSILDSVPDIEVVGTAPDPFVARQMIKELNPDVVTLDVEMPKMDGMTFLQKIMTLRPMPVVMVSSLTKRGADITLRALECGAIDFVTKPGGAVKDALGELKAALIPKVRAAANATLPSSASRQDQHSSRPVTNWQRAGTGLIAIGASTGGVTAIQAVLSALPPTSPGVVIVQHMPPTFTKSFAARLDKASQLTVVEARDGERIARGHAYVAPGGQHLEVAKGTGGFRCHVHDGPLISDHRPSADLMFQSVARHVGARSVGIILTGMGRDGAEGLLAMRNAGATTLGQNQASCVVYGMPKAAMEIGAVASELRLEDIGKEICSTSEAA